MIPTDLINQKKKDPLTKLNKVFDYKQSKGMAMTIEGVEYHFQCRPLDMTNWGNLLVYLDRNESILTAAGETVTLMTEEDIPITVTPLEAISIIESIQRYYNALYGARWSCKEYFATVTDRAEREAIDVLNEFETRLSTIIGA